ncbi:hypothetical protein MMC22_010324 [Lobaria immixta]|nr:hypothetical protein [Lobaria immixta]
MVPNDQIQTNLNNNTANFCAHHLALLLTQLCWPANITQTYKGKMTKWNKFCNDYNYEDGKIVYKAKLIQFLQEWVMSGFSNKNQDHNGNKINKDKNKNKNGWGDDAE